MMQRKNPKAVIIELYNKLMATIGTAFTKMQ
jgi:hypothetical protein